MTMTSRVAAFIIVLVCAQTFAGKSLLDREEIKTQVALTVSTVLPAVFNIVSCIYCYQGRDKISSEDPNSDATFYASQSLLVGFITHIVGANLRLVSIPVIFINNGFWLAVLLSTLAAMTDTVSLVTTSVAYGVENTHKYPIELYNSTTLKRGTANPEFPILLGTAIPAWLLGLANLAFYRALAP